MKLKSIKQHFLGQIDIWTCPSSMGQLCKTLKILDLWPFWSCHKSLEGWQLCHNMLCGWHISYSQNFRSFEQIYMKSVTFKIGGATLGTRRSSFLRMCLLPDSTHCPARSVNKNSAVRKSPPRSPNPARKYPP